MKKKGVVEFMETFIIIFVVFIILGLGLFFFWKVSISETKQTAEEACMLTSYEMLLYVMEMPEIQCSIKAKPRDCIDTAKLLSFGSTDAARALGKGACKRNIVVKQVYPAPDARHNSTECTSNQMRDIEFPKSCGQWTLAEQKEEGKAARTISVPVSLYYPNIKEYGIGKLIITTYTVT